MKHRYDEFNRNKFESHRLAESLIESDSVVLDIGCATGYFAKELLKKNCTVWGVDNDPDAIKKAKSFCKKTILCDIDLVSKFSVPEKYFDYVVLTDVIEHLRNPDKVLKMVKPCLKKGGKIIVSVPNIAHASIRWMLLRGEFQYTDTGILDKTHIHFFTRDSIQSCLVKSGYKILTFLPTNGMCKVPFLFKITDRLQPEIQYKIVSMFPEMFSYQFIILAQPK